MSEGGVCTAFPEGLTLQCSVHYRQKPVAENVGAHQGDLDHTNPGYSMTCYPGSAVSVV